MPRITAKKKRLHAQRFSRMVDWADANPRRITERFSRKIEPNAAVYLPENKEKQF